MKIAVTYDNGNIFQHFGKTENFKVYEVEDNKVVSSEVIGSNGTGHGALAGLLSDQGVNVLICGGIGGGAQAALAEAGVELCSGAEGDVDAAVEAYLNGTLTSAGATCDHHDHEEGHSCGGHCGSHEEEESSCGGSCGTCGGGCGAPTPVMEGKNVGKTISPEHASAYRSPISKLHTYDTFGTLPENSAKIPVQPLMKLQTSQAAHTANAEFLFIFFNVVKSQTR